MGFSYHHSDLPHPFDRYVSLLILENVSNADYYLMVCIIALISLVFIQLKAFARPKPVPLKKLAKRPVLQILFKPDDSIHAAKTSSDPQQLKQNSDCQQSHHSSTRHQHPLSPSAVRSVIEIFRTSSSPVADETKSFAEKEEIQTAYDSDVEDDRHEHSTNIESPPKDMDSPFAHFRDLPDSFAPLLSSSQVEIIQNNLSPDLVHAIQLKANITITEGRHEIPLDKDNSRPQFVIQAPKTGAKISISAAIGSDRFTTEEDLETRTPTTARSQPMVKTAGLVLDPPLPLANVAPTLIHFPTLFEDKFVPALRRIQIVRFAIDALFSLSSFLEKILWIIESKAQVHLSRVNINPIYKGSTPNDDPQWRLSLSFSGHVLFFGWIPIPFINLTLPTFIIPQPHSLLRHLLTSEPLASAKVKHENIAEKRIALALLDLVQSWNIDFTAVATPPALGVDVTLSGGVALAVELMAGRDPGAGMRRQDVESSFHAHAGHIDSSISGNSMSSWSTNADTLSHLKYARKGSTRPVTGTNLPPIYDANNVVPWSFLLKAKGTVSRDRISVHVTKCKAAVDDMYGQVPSRSSISTAGSFAVWRADLSKALSSERIPAGKKSSYSHLAALASSEESPSVGSIMLYPDDHDISPSNHKFLRVLEYDYAFDVFETNIDAVTLSIGASHPMLKGGTMITAILESIYALGSATAREGAVIDPGEWRQKRNILRHLPAVDLTFGVQHVFIPPESLSYSDDGQTKCTPEMEGGRIMIRLVGGIGDNIEENNTTESEISPVSEGIKVISDFGIESLMLHSETNVKEFPELEIFEGAKLESILSGRIESRINSHLRPQQLSSSNSITGPNIKNPLEAYEIDFSSSTLTFKIKESSATLGHRRIIIPAETSIGVKVVESVVDMSLEGKTQCELSWDFQLSPILQTTNVGESPIDVAHEHRQQLSLLIAPLRQGRINFHVSSVGGIVVTKAKTSREDRKGLYDWKFFNALVSPDEESPALLLKVLHDKRTMDKCLQVIKLINEDLHKILNYMLKQVWRAKEIFDAEGVSDPGHAIPGHKMARLVSLFLCGDVNRVANILPIIRRVTVGEGLDVVKVKELLREHVDAYNDWAPEIDRAVRWLAVMLGPMAAPQPYVEAEVPPLCELSKHFNRFDTLPSAYQIYDKMGEKIHLPLEKSFSNLIGHIAPYLSLRQIGYFLESRKPSDWQQPDLKRLRYVYSVKKKVQQISESYGGLSFLPQSFLVSVFLGEATRASLRASKQSSHRLKRVRSKGHWSSSTKTSTLTTLRKRRMQAPKLGEIFEGDEGYVMTPAGRVASQSNFDDFAHGNIPEHLLISLDSKQRGCESNERYELGDSLLGPQDVAILLQAGLTSPMKSSTVVQLNQRMLLDLIASQPKTFAIAVLAEIGTPGGQGSPRGLTSALMALLELEQSSFTHVNRLDMHQLLESWLPGFKMPNRADYMAGGRWARQSYYEAIYSVAKSILEDAECYMALKGHLQRVRRFNENDPIPEPRKTNEFSTTDGLDSSEIDESTHGNPSRFVEATNNAIKKITFADDLGKQLLPDLVTNEIEAKKSSQFEEVILAYRDAFSACSDVLKLDELAFQTEWFRSFYQRNYDALMIYSIVNNVLNDVDNVRDWLLALWTGRGAHFQEQETSTETSAETPISNSSTHSNTSDSLIDGNSNVASVLSSGESEQEILDLIIDAVISREEDRRKLKDDPLVRMLIPNPPGNYDFSIVSAMGVITEGERGLELQAAFSRLKKSRGVAVIRSDTGTARSFEFNAAKIEEAIESVSTSYGLLGYSQGCANALTAESLLLSGSPKQQAMLQNAEGKRLVCRQLLFSAANGSMHGPASDLKMQRLIVMCEEFFKYQQGYFSRAFSSSVLELLNSILDSAQFQKFIGGAQSLLPDGCRAFWREAQHLAHIPTCTLRGIMDEYTTPESLEMISNLLTKQSGSSLHDSQVHVHDAVGYPVYTNNRNGRLLRNCAVGDGSIQRTHHWSPLSDEVEFVRTQRDLQQKSFDCAKDRHVFPWVDVNARFGFIKYKENNNGDTNGATTNK